MSSFDFADDNKENNVASLISLNEDSLSIQTNNNENNSKKEDSNFMLEENSSNFTTDVKNNIKWKVIQKIMNARGIDNVDQQIILTMCQEATINNK